MYSQAGVAQPVTQGVFVQPGQAQGGFMDTKAPNGLTWMQYCGSLAPNVDRMQNIITGPWGECMAWAKVFEIQNPNWDSMPQYTHEGPCGQVIEAMKGMGASQDVVAIAENLEQQCENAHQQGRPL